MIVVRDAVMSRLFDPTHAAKDAVMPGQHGSICFGD
jgi:hypothetical protein